MQLRKLLFLAILIGNILPLFLSSSSATHQEGASIVGVVLYPNGKPASGARVFRYRSDDPTGLQGGAISGLDGSFVLDDLLSGISYSICASKTEEGFLDPFFLPFGLRTGGHCEHIVPRAGTNPGKIILRLAERSGTILGRVIDAQSRQSISGVKVTLYRPLKLQKDEWVLVDSKSATWVPSVTAYANGAGKFSFSNLPQGQFFLKVESKGYRPWFYPNQSDESSAKPVQIMNGSTRTVLAALEAVRAE